MFVLTATLDFLHEHALQLVLRARQLGLGENQWKLDPHNGMPHDFLLFPAWLLPYSSVGVAHAAAFIVRQITPAVQSSR